MLKENGYSKDTIVTFKIVNGDEIIAKVVAEDETGFTVSKPCTAIPSRDGLGLIQTMLTSDLNKSIVLDRQHMMMHAPTVEDVKNHYIETTTGIKPASAGGIIT